MNLYIHFIFAYPERTTTEDINGAFNNAAGYSLPTVVVPGWLIAIAAFGFEILGKLGLRTAINRARVRKLIQSTNVYPKVLAERGWRFEISLTEALRRWNETNSFK